MAAEGLPCATPCRELDKHHLMESLPDPGGRDHDHCIPILQMETQATGSLPNVSQSGLSATQTCPIAN